MDEEATPSTTERGGAQPPRTDVEDPQTNMNGDQIVSQGEVISRAVSSAISEEQVTVSAQAGNGEATMEQVHPETPISDGARDSVDQTNAGGDNPAQAEPATPREGAIAIQGDQNADSEVIGQAEQTNPSEEPMTANGEQPRAGLVNTVPNGQTPISEELVTVPIMELQQLVEFCAQVLRESRSREGPAPDLQSGPLPTSLPDITTDPLEVVGNYIFTDEDFGTASSFGRSHYSIPPQHKQEVDEIWDSVEKFPIHELFTSKEDPSAKSLIESCLTVANLDVLFRDDALLDPEFRGVQELFKNYVETAYSSNTFSQNYPFDWKLLVTVCAYGSKVDDLGGILQGCYSSGVLERPNSPEPSRYMSDIWTVIHYMLLFNRAFTISLSEGRTGISTYGYWFCVQRCREILYGMLRPCFTGRSLHAVFGISPAQLFRMLSIANSEAKLKPHDFAVGTTFRLDDLNVKSLVTLGGLRVVWTQTLEDHLLLDLASMILYVVWEKSQSWGASPMAEWERIAIKALSAEFCGLTYSGDGLPSRLDSEIIRSWAFLFATDPRLEICKKDYESVDSRNLMTPDLYFDPKPYKLFKCYEDIRRRHLGEDFGNIYADSYLEIVEAAQSKRLVPYAQFPVYENRLRQLRHYMDSQKPRGFRQLWRDKRDTLNYYTFWGVIIFGSLSIFLAFFSLAVSVAQTVASFKALNAS